MSYDRDDDYDDRPRRRNNSGGGDLTAIDWILCILCPGIGCIVGIIRLISGNSSGGKMIGISLVVIVISTIIRVAISGMK